MVDTFVYNILIILLLDLFQLFPCGDYVEWNNFPYYYKESVHILRNDYVDKHVSAPCNILDTIFVEIDDHKHDTMLLIPNHSVVVLVLELFLLSLR